MFLQIFWSFISLILNLAELITSKDESAEACPYYFPFTQPIFAGTQVWNMGKLLNLIFNP